MRHALLVPLIVLAAAWSPRAALRAEPPPDASALEIIEARVFASIRTTRAPTLPYPGTEHLAKARTLAAAGETGEALAALDTWLAPDYRHRNWWVNHVPIPRAVGEVALLLRDDLGAARRARVDRVLRRAWPPPRGGTGRGANLFYRFDAGVLRALLARDAALLQSVFHRAAAEIRITDGEGIQEDLSFHQHGPQLYTGSYGLEFLRGAIRVATLGDGTRLALSAERVDLLLSLLLDGLQWMVQGEMIDPGAQGRNFSRTGAGRGGRVVAGFCRDLVDLGVPRSDELTTYAQTLDGNRCFWRSDFMVHRRPGWYLSTKMASVRTVGTESGNGEGLKQYHLADGACIVMRRGDEYDGVQPVWSWRRVPGTTCAQGRDALPLVNWGRGARGSSRFVGGASDGRDGVAVMHLDKAGVRARKAWFYLGDSVVCLGAGIRADGEHDVVTTINQCLARTAVARGEGWCHHDGVGYVVLDGTLDTHVAKQRGTWRSINRGLSDAVVEREVFSAWIDHGPRPRDAAYAYRILPDASPERTARETTSSPIRILANTEAVQAVRHDELALTGIVFHEAGALAGVRVSRPCVLLLRETAAGRELALADPAWGNEPVQVELPGADEPMVFGPRDGRTERHTVPR